MSLVEKVVAQFARPTGFWGDIAGFIMAHRPSNLERNEWAISLLNLQPSDRVLEIGFGPGVTIQKMSEIVTHGVIWGMDHSEVMFRQASKRNQRAISVGRVRLALTSVSQLPAFDGPFDKILDVNGFQFWDNQIEALKRLREQLRPGGIIALVHQPRNPGATEDDATEAGERFAHYLEMAGFKDIKSGTEDDEACLGGVRARKQSSIVASESVNDRGSERPVAHSSAGEVTTMKRRSVMPEL